MMNCCNFGSQINSAILYDAVFLVNTAMEVLNARIIEDDVLIDPLPLSCDESTKYHAGPNISSVIKEVLVTNINKISICKKTTNFRRHCKKKKKIQRQHLSYIILIDVDNVIYNFIMQEITIEYFHRRYRRWGK